MSDHIERAAEVLRDNLDDLTPQAARLLARRLDHAGLLVTPAHDAAVAAKALREAADALVSEHGNDGFPTPWLRERADRIERAGGSDV